jgi:hypothetical protein
VDSLQVALKFSQGLPIKPVLLALSAAIFFGLALVFMAIGLSEQRSHDDDHDAHDNPDHWHRNLRALQTHRRIG